jgi:acetyl-CoA/propionyl-CoA carboxylase biotin carboxyl carrier protein
VVEAMKMEQPLLAHRAGRITNLDIEVGGSVASGVVLCEIVEQ